MTHVYELQLREALYRLPVQATTQADSLVLDFSELGKSLRWKDQSWSLKFFEKELSSTSVQINGEELSFNPNQISAPDFHALYLVTKNLQSLTCGENPQAESIWQETTDVIPGGFDQNQPSQSKDYLETIYQGDLAVKEKKPFVIDLERSKGPYMVSLEPENFSVNDAASQIASMALGFNHADKKTLPLRSEIYQENLEIEDWDVYQAFTGLLKRESGLPHCYLVNSGAEAVETSIRACQTAHPERKKIIAFEGSFHGRSLLALHATFNPAKREPFEVFPGNVSFIPFPETKTLKEAAPEPEEWLAAWGSSDDTLINQHLPKWKDTQDEVLSVEVIALQKIREQLAQEPALCVMIEPMLCEGGDRYGTNRFYRALRVLTRAFDTPLIFDEVQSGLKLGGTFLWTEKFDLVDLDGKLDRPDCIAMAKKTQVGVCLTRFEQDLPLETSPASIYRGYQQMIQTWEFDSSALEEKVTTYLNHLQAVVSEEVIRFPRNLAMCFGFDLPSNEILMKMISHRFGHGILFYPAGSQTARFRMLIDTRPIDLAHTFLSIYQCIESTANEGLMGKAPSIEEYLAAAPEEIRSDLEKAWKQRGGSAGKITAELPWKNLPETLDSSKLESLGVSYWNQLFAEIVRGVPQILKAPGVTRYTLADLHKRNVSEIIDDYLKDPSFTRLDLYFQLARKLGYSVNRLTQAEVTPIKEKIRKLEAAVYEPERRDDPDMFERETADPKAIFLALSDGEKLAAICAAAPISHFQGIQGIGGDPITEDPSALYGIDLTIHPDYQGKSLGIRLKAEQFLASLQQGSPSIRSRNRWPEAKVMAQLNRKLGAVTVKKTENDYDGTGVALHQSISTESKTPFLGYKDSRFPGLKNKTSLANFVSTSYVHNLCLVGAILPDHLKHLYLSSGRAEAIEKMVKLLRAKRKTATKCISFQGDYFGITTASARSLGGVGPQWYPWPVIELDSELAALTQEIKAGADTILGVFVEVKGKSESQLKAIIDLCHQSSVPVIFGETDSAFYQFSDQSFFAASSELPADGIVLYGGNQLGVVAVGDEYFLETPLAMISTWDGDEFSLAQFKDRILKERK